MENKINVSKTDAVYPASENCINIEESIDRESEDWQSNTRNIGQRLNKLFYCNHFSDLTVEFEETSFRVHKLILAMHSPVYETMFYSSIPYADDKISVQDISAKTFKWILSYMYLGVYVLHDINMAIEIYSFAHEKQMDNLVRRCSKFISEKVSNSNAVEVLKIANLYDDNELKSVCTKKVFEKRESIFVSRDIGEMQKKVLKDILSGNKIYCSEKEVFNSIYFWAKVQLQRREESISSENMRKEMNDFFPHINFLLMNSNYFISEVMKTGILTADESLAILNCINKQTNKYELPSFVSKTKKNRYYQEANRVNYSVSLNRFSQCNMSFVYNNTYEEYSDRIIVFRVSEDIFISSIKLKPCCYIGHWKIYIMNFDDKELGVSSNDYSPYNFERMVPISANKCYLCVMKGKGKRYKHPVVDYEASVGTINFVGIAIACNIMINFTA